LWQIADGLAVPRYGTQAASADREGRIDEGDVVRPADSEPAGTAPRSVVSTAWLALALGLALLHLLEPIAWLPRQVARNYNEGWNAYHADAVFSERPLYGEPEALFPNNYPPLSFAIVAVASGATGDPVRAGRIVSLLAFFALLTLIGRIVASATGSGRLGILAGLLACSWMGAAFGEYVAMNDPQMLGHALMLGGLVPLLGGRSQTRLVAAATLMVLGGLVKHNLIALPLAVTLWLYTSDREAFRGWLRACGGVAVIAFAALFWLHGASVFESMLRPREASLAFAVRNSADWLRALAVPLVLGLLVAREAWRDPDDRVLVLYAAVGLAVGSFFSAGEGVGVNAYFDLLIALSLLGPLLLARLSTLAPEALRVIPMAALTLGLLADPLIQAPAQLRALPARLDELGTWEVGTREDIAYLERKGELVICETLALCFWAGKPAAVDLYNSQQLFHAGVVDEQALLDRIEAGEFAIVQLTGLPRNRDDERVSAQLTHALLRHYVVDRIGENGVFLRPRASAKR
jgi:hypothetical protein